MNGFNDSLADIRALVAMVARRRHRTCFADIGRDDLLAEGLMAVYRAWSKFDADKGALATFVCLVANRRITDLYRNRDRAFHHEQVLRDEAFLRQPTAAVA